MSTIGIFNVDVETMRILIIQPGIGTYRLDFFNELAKRCTLKIVYFFDESSEQKFPEPLASKLVGCDVEKVTGGWNIRKYYPIRPRLGRVIRDFHPDIVVGYEFNTLMLHLVLLRCFSRTKWKLFLWTSDNLEIAAGCKSIRRIFRRIGVTHSDGMLLYSNQVKIFYAGLFPKSRSMVLPNIQSETRIRQSACSAEKEAKEFSRSYNLENKKVFLFVGRLHPVKNIPVLLEAWATAELNNAVLVIIGNGSEKENINKKILDFKISDTVICTGALYGNQLWAWFLLGNTLILPSTFEPYGAVVNEALACGIPCVVSKHVGANVLITKENGIVLDADSSTCLRDALKAMDQTLSPKNEYALRPSLMSQDLNQYIDDFLRFSKSNGN